MRIPAVLAALALAGTLTAAPALAQSADEPPGAPDKPVSEQLEDLIRGLVESVEPALERLRDTFEVFERVDSVEHYKEPEILPNGDIIIRRKPDAPPFEPDQQPAEEEPGVRT